MQKSLALALAGVLFALAVPAHAVSSMVQLSGLSWEDGGVIPSDAGDQLTAVGVVTHVKKPMYWSPSRFEYTWSMTDLTSLGETVYGTTHVIRYSGGTFRMHVDMLPANAAYGINPPNATCPSSFTDGDALYLEGYFTEFTATLNTATGAGSLYGAITFTGGNAYPQLQDPDGWTVGANITRTTPEGWDMDVNATLFVSGPLGVETASWSSVKALYR